MIRSAMNQDAGKPLQQPLKIGDIEVYYHALSHHIAHWAAYIAMVATLITIGASLSGFQGAMRPFRIAGSTGAVLAAWAGAIYFIRGMDTYGSILCEAVPKPYLLRTQTFRHDLTILIGKSVATACAIADLLLVAALCYGLQ